MLAQYIDCNTYIHTYYYYYYYYYTRLMALFPGLPRWAATRKVKPILILLKQETVSGSSISWAICKSAPHSHQTDNHASTSPLSFFTGRMPFLSPNQQPKSNEGNTYIHTYKFILRQKSWKRIWGSSLRDQNLYLRKNHIIKTKATGSKLSGVISDNRSSRL